MTTSPGVRAKLSIRQLAAASGTVAAARVFDLGASYVFYLLLARAVSTGEFGRLIIAMTLAQTASVATRLGLDSGALRKVAEAHAAGEERAGRIIFTGAAVAAALSLAGTALIAVAVARVPQFASYRAALSGANIFVLLAIPFLGVAPIFALSLRGRGDIAQAAVAESILQPAAALLMVCFALWSGNGAFASAALLVSTLATLAFAVFRLHAAGALCAGAPADGIVTLGARVVMSSGMNVLAAAADVLVLARFVGPASVALYAAAVKTARALLLVNDASLIAIAPSIPHLLRARDTEHLGIIYRTVVRWNALLTAPAALLFVVAPELILRIFGHNFEAAAPLLRMTAVTCAIFVFAGPAKTLLVMAQHEGFLTRNAALNLAVTAALMLLLVPRYGAIGAAAALLVATCIQRVLLLARIRHAIGIQPIGARNVIVFGAFACAVATWALAVPVGAVVAALAAMGVFIGGAALARFDAHDRDVVRGLVAIARRS